MNDDRKHKQLDDELRNVIGQETIQFDANAWKDRHAEAYRQLLARGKGQSQATATNHSWRTVLLRHVGKFACAAAIIIVATLTFLAPRPTTTSQSGPDSATPADMFSNDIVTFQSLTLAYRRGGEDALNRQLDTAERTLGPRPDRSLLRDLMDDIRG